MNFTIDHFNINVLDLEKSLEFYHRALGLKEIRRKTADDGSYIIVFLGDNSSSNKLELTWLKSMDRPYDLGDDIEDSVLCLQLSSRKHCQRYRWIDVAP